MTEKSEYMTQEEKEKVASALFDHYNPVSIGQIEKYPPNRFYFVSLYFEDTSFCMDNRYNYTIGENLYDFQISNIAKTQNETNVTVRIRKQ